MPGKLETRFQNEVLIPEIKRRFLGCIILKNDTENHQGRPDLTVIYKDHAAFLEVKRDRNAPFRPNQEYYLDLWGEHGFTAVVYPENLKETLYAMESALQPQG